MKKKSIAALSLIAIALVLAVLNFASPARFSFFSPGLRTPEQPELTNTNNVEAPVYFTIFKFISNYVPFKENGKLE